MLRRGSIELDSGKPQCEPAAQPPVAVNETTLDDAETCQAQACLLLAPSNSAVPLVPLQGCTLLACASIQAGRWALLWSHLLAVLTASQQGWKAFGLCVPEAASSTRQHCTHRPHPSLAPRLAHGHEEIKTRREKALVGIRRDNRTLRFGFQQLPMNCFLLFPGNIIGELVDDDNQGDLPGTIRDVQ